MTTESVWEYNYSIMGRKRTHPLKAYRALYHLSQADAAKHFGVSQAIWSRWERGVNRPNRDMCRRLVKETGASVEVLMGISL